MHPFMIHIGFKMNDIYCLFKTNFQILFHSNCNRFCSLFQRLFYFPTKKRETKTLTRKRFNHMVQDYVILSKFVLSLWNKHEFNSLNVFWNWKMWILCNPLAMHTRNASIFNFTAQSRGNCKSNEHSIQKPMNID